MNTKGIKELFNTINNMAITGKLEYKYLKFTLAEYRVIQAIFNRLADHGMAETFMENVVKFFALNGLITCQTGINWIIKVPENF